MNKPTRRQALQTTTAAALAAAGTSSSANAGSRTAHSRPGLQFSEIIIPGETNRMQLLKQVGVNHAIGSVTGHLAKMPRSEYEAALAKFKADCTKHSLNLAGVESSPVPSEKIKLGVDGRDEELENYAACIKALANIGVNMICYNFMAGLGWYRTRVDLLERGGALTSEFDNAFAKQQGLTQWGEIPEQRMWDNITYFLKAIIPVAEKAGVNMALHPDDPPLTPLRGIGRICISAANYRRILSIVPSPVNGITYCQANFVAMGEDVYTLAQEWLKQKKIFFVHFRDIEGKGQRFRETFHDNGPTDMIKMLKIYADGGFNGPIRPDHAPTLEGEENSRPGYAMKGKIYAFGYMKGAMEALGLPNS